MTDPQQKKKIITRLGTSWRECIKRATHVLTYRLCWVNVQGLDARERRMRRERIAACTQVMQCLIEHMDVLTMIVGRGHDGTHYGLKLETIAEKTGLGERRIDRAIHDLHQAGFLETWTRAQRKSDGYRALVAIRQIPAAIIDAVGLAVHFAKAAAKEWAARKKAKAAQERPQRELDAAAYRQKVKAQRRGFTRHSEPAATPIGNFLSNFSPG